MHLPVETGRGTVPPARMVSSSLPGREPEIRAVIESPHAIQWLLGDSGTGKSTLVREGIVPAWSAGPVVSLQVAKGARCRAVIIAIGAEMLARATDPDRLAARLHQFQWLLERDSTEAAADYLASCVARPGTHWLIAIDQLERLLPTGDEDEKIVAGTLERIEWLRFIDDLVAAGPVSVLLAAWTDAGAAYCALRRRAGLAAWPAPTIIRDMPVGTVTCFRAGKIPVARGLRIWLVETVHHWPGSLPLAARLLSHLAREFSGSGHIDLPSAERSAALGARFAAVAEQALSVLPATTMEAAWPFLMSALHPGVGNLDRAKTIRLSDLPSGAAPLIDPLVDAGILRRAGDSAETITLGWSWAPALAWWDRATAWVERRRRLDLRLGVIESARREWEKDGRTPVRLLHAAPLIAEAREILALRHEWLLVPEETVDFLTESIAVDDRVRLQFARHRRHRSWLIAGVAAAALAGLTAAILAFS